MLVQKRDELFLAGKSYEEAEAEAKNMTEAERQSTYLNIKLTYTPK